MSEDEVLSLEEVEETTQRSSSSGSSALQVQAIKVTLELSELWEELVEGKISLEEFKELKEQLQSGLEETKKRRRRRQ
ncbi:hypothetical protein IPA_05815 [Ignicoccus pacificus DSM 13166]|uniref:Uncharacterized protein n=1 Tax=Ignicoccus pacificus DSM 13166 TaxID=940294 RepID=A0A977KBA5_9CREN|nr:hypothetical protein IPA_05815 [Ignicoccus pacificus DSM 13166]